MLKSWFRRFVEVRDAEGAERCLRTATDIGLPPEKIADMIFSTATDHLYIDIGHIVDFTNKACEMLDHIGWDHAGEILPTLATGLTGARRSEELSAWRQPVDIARLLFDAYEKLPELVKEGQKAQRPWQGRKTLLPIVMGEAPASTIEAMKDALREGATPQELAATVAYAAALRIARFPTSNEFTDWDTALHTFTYANAIYQAVKRSPSVELLRGVFDAAMSVYLDRFLNIPAVPLPRNGNGSQHDPSILETLLKTFDIQQRVDETGELTARYLAGGGDPSALMATLGEALLREDSGFHTFQVVEAGFRQYEAQPDRESKEHILIAVARYLAAHTPTNRAIEQTFKIAWRLHRGEEIYEDV